MSCIAHFEYDGSKLCFLANGRLQPNVDVYVQLPDGSKRFLTVVRVEPTGRNGDLRLTLRNSVLSGGQSSMMVEARSDNE